MTYSAATTTAVLYEETIIKHKPYESLMAQESSSPEVIKSDVTLFRILEGLRETGGAGVTDLSDRAGISKSATYKHLKTLTTHGYVRKDAGVYELDFRFFWLGGYVMSTNRLCREAKIIVSDLHQEIGEMVTFAIKDRTRGMWIHLEGDIYGIRKQYPMGGRFYLHQPAMGKAMLARLETDEVNDIVDETGLPQSTESTVESREALHERLDEIRDRGFAINIEEHQTNAQAIAASVYDAEENTLGAIGIAGPANETTIRTFQDEYSQILLDTVNKLQLQIKYQ